MWFLEQRHLVSAFACVWQWSASRCLSFSLIVTVSMMPPSSAVLILLFAAFSSGAWLLLSRNVILKFMVETSFFFFLANLPLILLLHRNCIVSELHCQGWHERTDRVSQWYWEASGSAPRKRKAEMFTQGSARHCWQTATTVFEMCVDITSSYNAKKRVLSPPFTLSLPSSFISLVFPSL